MHTSQSRRVTQYYKREYDLRMIFRFLQFAALRSFSSNFSLKISSTGLKGQGQMGDGPWWCSVKGWLNVSPPNSYIEVLTHSVMVLEDGVFGRYLSLE